MTTRIDLVPALSPGRWNVLLDGEIIEGARDPEYAARTLVARGVTGRAEVWLPGRTSPRVIIPDVERTAGWSVVRMTASVPRRIRWRPFGEGTAQDHASGETGPFGF